ncbi:MAG: LysM peptidoglycan-binding domain-containing protein [Clostridia bacterium]
MDEKMEKEVTQDPGTTEFTDEEFSQLHSNRSGASLHTRVMEELMKQKQDQFQQHSKERNGKTAGTAAPRVNISRSMTIIFGALGIMLILILGLTISQMQMNSKYQKVIASMSEQGVPAGGMQQDTRIAALENKMAQIEEKVDTVIEQFDWGDVGTPESPVATPGNSAGKTSSDGQYMKYVVQKGDTLWSLSVRFFGDGQKTNELMRINGFAGPNDLKSGLSILVPSKK